MPILTIHANKGGQGTTTVAAALALLHAAGGHRTLLVDTPGDQPAILGIAEPQGSGLADYLDTDQRLTLAEVTTRITDRLDLIPTGTGMPEFDTYTYGLLTSGLGHYDTVIVDTSRAAHPWNRHADRSVLVTRPCYLAIRRTLTQPTPTDIVVITEPGRSLTTHDIEICLGTPVTATIPHDPAIARTIDAGFLTTQLPRSLARALRPLVATTPNSTTDVAR